MRKSSSSNHKRFAACAAQSITEYAVLIGLLTAAVLGMQLYLKRGIQAGVKMAADQMSPHTNDPTGEKAQRDGMVDIDLNLIWKVKGDAQITTAANSLKTLNTAAEGSVSRGNNETSTSTGTLSLSLFAEQNQ